MQSRVACLFSCKLYNLCHSSSTDHIFTGLRYACHLTLSFPCFATTYVGFFVFLRCFARAHGLNCKANVTITNAVTRIVSCYLLARDLPLCSWLFSSPVSFACPFFCGRNVRPRLVSIWGTLHFRCGASTSFFS